MVPPERTFGPIGWKGLFGGDDDEESDDETSTGDESRATETGTGEERGGRGVESPGGPGSSHAGEEIEEARADRTEARSGPAAPDRDDSPEDVGERIHEERTRRTRQFTADRPADRTESSDDQTGSPVTGASGAEADDDSGRTEPVDAGTDPEPSTGESGEGDDPADIWVNPLDEEPADTTADPSDWEWGILDGSSAPGDESRVRTSESGTVAEDEGADEPEVGDDDSEVTFGPIGLNGVGSEAETSAETATERETSRPPETTRRRTGTAEETATEVEEEGFLDHVPWSISLTAIGVGVGLLVFLDIVSLMVPLIAAVGAGIVGGFVAGYISGGTVRGGLHALAVGVIGGITVGYLTALIGALLGLFLEPATLLGHLVGPITPELGMFGAWGPLLVMVLVTVMIAIDATIAGAVGGTLRSMVDEVR